MSRGPGGLESWTDERQPRSEYNGAVGWRAEIEDPVLLGGLDGALWDEKDI
jgi:hypothetical protein